MQIKRLTMLLMLTDALLASGALVLGHVFHLSGSSDLATIFGPACVRLVVFVGMIVFFAYFCEMYRWHKRLGRLNLVARAVVSLMVTFFFLSALYYIFPVTMIGRSSLSSALLIFGVLQVGAHLAWLTIFNFPGVAQKILIIGTGPLAEKMGKLFHDHPGHYVFAGFVRPPADPLTVSEEWIVGNICDISMVIEREKAGKLVVAVTEQREVLPVLELLRCKLGGVDIADAFCFYEEMTGKLLLENIQPSWFLYSNGFRVTPFLRVYKRGLDIFLSLVGIGFSLPIWPIIALLVRFDSPGPVFFKQIRVGERDRGFYVYKFRTMRQDAEKETGAVWAIKEDPRVTRIGKILRASRLDEIPQLYNVLIGDMSFVGPRPERPEFVDTLNQKIPYYSERHFMKPGVTGWAQVCYPYGASEEDALEKLRYDLYYIKNYSLLLDFMIILETVKVVLFGRGGR